MWGEPADGLTQSWLAGQLGATAEFLMGGREKSGIWEYKNCPPQQPAADRERGRG